MDLVQTRMSVVFCYFSPADENMSSTSLGYIAAVIIGITVVLYLTSQMIYEVFLDMYLHITAFDFIILLLSLLSSLSSLWFYPYQSYLINNGFHYCYHYWKITCISHTFLCTVYFNFPWCGSYVELKSTATIICFKRITVLQATTSFLSWSSFIYIPNRHFFLINDETSNI